MRCLAGGCFGTGGVFIMGTGGGLVGIAGAAIGGGAGGAATDESPSLLKVFLRCGLLEGIFGIEELSGSGGAPDGIAGDLEEPETCFNLGIPPASISPN